MVRGRFFASLLAVALLAGATGACGSSGGKGTGSAPGAAVKPDECGLAAFAAAKKPVEVTFWHAMTRANAQWLTKTVQTFNASQHDVHVKLLAFPTYQDALTKYKAGLTTGDIPDVAQLEETTVQVMLDSQSTIPMQACVDADHYSLTDFVPRAIAYYTTGGVLRAMPWSVSNPVLFYDASAFRKAGLDPSKPPRTFAEIEADSRKIVASGAARHGIALRVEPYIFEYLNAKSGGTLVNNANGRTARATAATIDTPVANAIWTWWKHMVQSGLALNTGSTPGNIDHLLAVGNHDAAMTFEASGVLGTVRQVLQSGEFKGVQVMAAPLPELQVGGGVPVGDGALWIPKNIAPEKRAAAWQFVKYLSSPEQQAALSIEGGYVPIRQSAASVPALRAEWQSDPSFRAGYAQLLSGTVSAANTGSLIGDYQGVRDAVKDGMSAMLMQNMTPEQALQLAQREATQKIQNYNSRVGA
jgi:sn-glycerol 3-phosphate transport system substrate-binding protein